MLKRTLCFLMVALCFSACSTPSVKIDPPEPPPPVQVAPEETPSTPVAKPQKSDGNKPAKKPAQEEVDEPAPPEEATLYSIAFLGYESAEGDITPPYAYISDEQFHQMEALYFDGDEYYLIVPTTETGFVEIFAYDAYDPVDGKGELLHTSVPGVPVIFRCNVSDIAPNTLVCVTDGDATATLSPVVHQRSMTAMFGTGGSALLPLPVVDPYFDILLDTLGPDYLLGRKMERYDDEGTYIDGIFCMVYTIGTEQDGQYFVEEWFAAAADGRVYELDIIVNTWNLYAPKITSLSQMDRIQVESCLRMLNEYLQDEFSVEYYETGETVSQSIFKAGSDTHGPPAQLIGLDEEIPPGFVPDPAARTYYLVYNTDCMVQLLAQFGLYFTPRAMEDIKEALSYEFLEFENAFYLVRGGRGYGATTLDFDSIDDSNLKIDGTLTINTLLFDQPADTLKVTFRILDGVAKIDEFLYVTPN